MTSTSNHQLFDSTNRVAQSLRNDRCQNVLYKAVFEHFKESKDIAAVLLTSKSFQNSSFGPNFLVNFIVDKDSIRILDSFLSPSSCLPLQFTPSLHVRESALHSDVEFDSITVNRRRISKFVGEIVSTKYFRSSLRSLFLETVVSDVVSSFFGNSSDAWPQLQDLRVEESGVDDTQIEIISKNALQLRNINLGDNWEITDVGLEHLSKLHSVVSLDLYNCSLITDAGLECISNNLVNITSLELSGCENITDAGLLHVSTLSGITSLNLYRCKITDFGLEHLSKLSHITSLDVSWCDEITDIGLEHLSKLSRLTSLNLCRCSAITDVGLELLAKLSNITSLNLRWCNLITYAGIENISKISGMAVLNLSFCDLVRDDALEVVSTLTRITSLNLAFCAKITDAGVEYVSKLSNITSLNLSGCKKITGAGLEHLVALTSATSITLDNCANVTAEAQQKLKTALPNCRIVG